MMKLGRNTVSAALILGLALLVPVVAGCSGSSVDTTLVSPATVIVTLGATTTAPPETTTTTAPAETTTTVADTTSSTVASQEPLTLSANAIAYAAGLEGTSQLDQPLYLVVGASFGTEQEAQTALDAALPLFGDMQANYIIQLSDNFDGLEPGSFVLIEAYWEESNATGALDFGRRAFPDVYVQAVTAKTADPIPVYEQLEGT